MGVQRVAAKKKRGRHYFVNLFLSIAVLSIFLIIVLSLSLYFNFRSYSLDFINKANEKTLVQLSNSILQVDGYARTFTASLFKNADVVTLMCDDDADIYTVMRSRKAVDNLISGIPFIQSVYLYNGRTGNYYSMGPNPVARNAETFFDADAARIISGLAARSHAVPQARRAPNTDMAASGTSDIYSYVIADFFAGSGKVENAVMLNVRFDWVYNSLYSVNDTLSGNARGNIIIVDSTGKAVGHSLGTLFLKDLSGEGYIRQILESGHETGSVVADYQGVPSVFTYVYVEDLQWYMLSITPYNYIAASVVQVENITILVCLLLTAAALVLAFLLSRQLYSPMRVLENSISSATNRLVSLENFKTSNLSRLKEELLRDIMLRKPETGLAGEKLKELGIVLAEQDTVLLVLFRLDRFEELAAALGMEGLAGRKAELCGIVLEAFGREAPCEAVDAGDDRVALMLNAGCGTVPGSAEADGLVLRIREVQALYRKYHAHTVSAFVSAPAMGLGEIPAQYQMLLRLSNYRIVYGHECVLTEQDMERCQDSRAGINNTAVQHLIDALKLGRTDAMEEQLAIIFTALHECEYNVLMSTLSYLTSSVFNALQQIERNGTLRFEEDMVAFGRRVAALETLDEICGQYMALFRRAAERMGQRKDQSTGSVIAGVVNTIETEYRDRNLCTDSLAARFRLSSAYLGRLFRESTSMSIPDYISNVRILRAKEMLEHGAHTVDEILDRIGWENKKYFYTVFKKATGVTPTEYRLKSRVGG